MELIIKRIPALGDQNNLTIYVDNVKYGSIGLNQTKVITVPDDAKVIKVQQLFLFGSKPFSLPQGRSKVYLNCGLRHILKDVSYLSTIPGTFTNPGNTFVIYEDSSDNNQ